MHPLLNFNSFGMISTRDGRNGRLASLLRRGFSRTKLKSIRNASVPNPKIIPFAWEAWPSGLGSAMAEEALRMVVFEGFQPAGAPREEGRFQKGGSQDPKNKNKNKYGPHTPSPQI